MKPNTLLATDQTFRLLFLQNPIPMWLHDRKTLAFLEVNQAAETKYGYSRDEFLSMRIDDIVSSENGSNTSSNAAASRPGNAAYALRHHRKKDGMQIDVEISTYSVEFAGYPAELVIAYDVTERRQMEEALIGSEARYRALVELSPEAIGVHSEGNIVFVNKRMTSLLGAKSPEELIGRQMMDFVHPEYRDFVQTRVAAMKREGKAPPLAEEKLLSLDGRVADVEVIATPFLYEGKPAVQIVARDISSRKHAEREMSLLAHALASTKDSVSITDLEDKTIFVNDAFVKMYGYTKDELLGKPVSIVRSPLTPPDVGERILPSTLAGGWYGELINRRKDGSDFPVELWTSLVRDEAGKPLAMVGVARDISDRRKAENSIRENEARLRAIIEAEPECVKIIAPDGRLLEMNASGLAMLEAASFADLQHKSLADFVVPEHRQGFKEHFRDTIEGKQHESFQFEVIGLRGGRRWLETNTVALRDSGNCVTALLGITRDITERKRAEETLRENEERYRTLFNLSPAGIMLIDSNGTILDVNDTFYRTHQYTKEELIGKDIRIVVPREEHHRVADHLKKILSGETLDHEVVNLRKDGTPCIVELRETSVSLPDGSRGILSVAHDVTERKKTEDALRENEQKFRTVVQNAQAVIFVLDSRGVFQLSDGQALANLGLQPGQVVGLSALEVYKEYPEVVENIRRALAGKETRVTAEVQGLIFDTFYSPYFDSNGKLAGVVGVATDITERKRSEELLRISEERYRRFFEEDLTGVFVSNPDGSFVDCNPAFVRIFGFASREDVLQSNASRLYLSAEQRAGMLDMLRRHKKLENFEITLRRCDGTQVHILENIVGTFDGEGNLVQLMGYLSDKTVQRQLEQQLIQSQKMESLGTLASGIAHDFNNILGIVLGHASLLGDARTPPEKASRHTDAILKATERGVGVVKQLLTFARKTEVLLESVRLNDIINELLKLLHETFPKTISIETSLSPHLPSIIADANQLHQVLLNLCVNARDAMPGGGLLTITTQLANLDDVRRRWPEATAFEYVILSVGDTGAGMDEATRARIFEPFFTTKEHGKGTGLGLATAYGIVQTHKGNIEVQSQPGRGTVFTLSFPVLPRKPDVYQRPEALSANLPGGTETILVVEDEPMLRDMMSELLRSKGYTVIVAEDGVAGAELYSRDQSEIALVISDLGLPRRSGDELFLALRSLNPVVKFILASGFVDPGVKAKLTREGLQHVLHKPYHPAHVLLKVREVLDAPT